MRRSNEPFFWSLFSAGGVVTAFLLPVLIVLTGFVLPADGISSERVADVFTDPVVRLLLFLLASLAFFHVGHRVRHLLIDLGLRAGATPVALACYGAAIAGSAWAATIAFA